MNAIILAAGIGKRLWPLTKDMPKCLIPVNGKPIIESQILILKKMGINDIYIVSGYMHNMLEYLSSKYNVEIIFNEMYKEYNNLYSLSLISDYLENTFILDGDVYIHTNYSKNYVITHNFHKQSCYFATEKKSSEEEWALEIDSNSYLKKINITKSPDSQLTFCMSGLSFWCAKDSFSIKQLLREYIEKDNFKNLFWDHIILDNINLFRIKVISIDGIYEIDTVDDFHYINNLLNNNEKHDYL